jgi:hypothetical protein
LEGAEFGEVDDIPGLAIGGGLLGGFEDHGEVVEAGVGHDALEGVERDLAEADVLVSVGAAVARGFGIVEVPDAELMDVEEGFEFLEGLVEALRGGEVVTGGEEVCGVEADGESLGLFDGVDDFLEVFESPAEGGALSGGDFEAGDGFESWEVVVDLVEGLGDALDAQGFSVAEVSAGVSDEVLDL